MKAVVGGELFPSFPYRTLWASKLITLKKKLCIQNKPLNIIKLLCNQQKLKFPLEMSMLTMHLLMSLPWNTSTHLLLLFLHLATFELLYIYWLVLYSSLKSRLETTNVQNTKDWKKNLLKNLSGCRLYLGCSKQWIFSF